MQPSPGYILGLLLFFKGSKVEIGMDMSCDVHTVQPLISMRTVVKYVILTK